MEVDDPEQISARYVRTYLFECKNRQLSDASVHAHARGVRALLRFMYQEGYTSQRITFKMPKVEQRPLPVLNPEEIKELLNACLTLRDVALLLLLIDSGARRGEAVALNWGDVDLKDGTVRIRRGKGKKSRAVVIGLRTRRTLIKYRRSVEYEPGDPLFQTSFGTRLKASGMRMALKRIGKRAGINLYAHKCRRTFATLSLRAGIGPLHLKGLLGHESLEMTLKYVRMVDDDLIQAHKEFGPIDHFLN